MLVGINWISPTTLPVIRQLIKDKVADFCEIMVDNVAHLPAHQVREALPDIPIALHIVASRFLEKTPSVLKNLADHLRPWIKQLNPIYVSDHLVRYTQEKNELPLITDLYYQRDYEHIKNQILLWQSLLAVPLYFENHASITSNGISQAAFYREITRDTHAGLLFDFSNAYIADQNGAGKLSEWESLLPIVKHFHVGGFRIEKKSQLVIDTHDAPIDEAVLVWMKKYFFGNKNANQQTLVIECDATMTPFAWQKEIVRVKQSIG